MAYGAPTTILVPALFIDTLSPYYIINFDETQTSSPESIANIAVDTVFAEELEVSVGDIVEVDWFVNEDDGHDIELE